MVWAAAAGFLLGVGVASASQPLPECAPDVIEALSTRTDAPITLTCSLSGRDAIAIRRPVVVENSGVVLDCGGGTLRPPGEDPSALLVRSRARGEGFVATTDVTVRDCAIRGHVRVMGAGRNGEAERVRRSSHLEGHTERLQNWAPRRIWFEAVRITGTGTIPLYLAPGVTEVTLTRSELEGESRSVALYLDAESARNSVTFNAIHTRTRRELVAVDGSAGNTIAHNRFASLQNGGIYLYRNCGEGGTVRHQPPQHNRIADNVFFYRHYRGASPAVWIGSRMGWRLYCGADAGFPFGSSVDGRDFARHNRVENNRIYGRDAQDMIRVWDEPNLVRANRTVVP